MPKKIYADISFYEKKLKSVMTKLGVEEYRWDYNRKGGWVEFFYQGQLYRFDHDIEQAANHGMKLSYGSDAFAQIVLALEDLCRIINRGIYDLSHWVAGMKFLPEHLEIPAFFRFMGFDTIPQTEEEVKKAYRAKVKIMHPDQGGTSEDFIKLTEAYNKCLEFLKKDASG